MNTNILTPIKALISKKGLNEKITTNNQILFLTISIIICSIINSITTQASFSKAQSFFSNIFGLPIILIVIATIFHVLITGISQKNKPYKKSIITISTHLISFFLISSIITLIVNILEINSILNLIYIFAIYYLINLTFNLKNYYNVSLNTIICVNIICFIIIAIIIILSLLNLFLSQTY